MILNGKNILITQMRLVDYAGSETVVLELAEYFSLAGANVVIYTNAYGNPIKKEFERLHNVSVVTNDDDLINKLRVIGMLDIVWIHHQLIPRHILDELPNAAYIFHHMSSYADLEYPNFWRIESNMASLVLCNSKETKDKIIKDGLLAGVEDRVMVFGNPAPSSFLSPSTKSQNLNSVLVVSNHVPSELKDAIDIIKKNNIDVVVFGSGGDNYDRITPDILKKYKAIITIGKTVQYSILMGIPVYCYDRFGGPGYLNRNNFKKSMDFNFSGRGFDKKEASAIADEIINKYDDSLIEARYLKSKYSANFDISQTMPKIIRLSIRDLRNDIKIDHRDIMSYLNIMNMIKSRTPSSAHSKDIIDNKVNKLNTEISRIYLSKDYRLGKAILLVPRFIKKLLKRIKK